MWERLQQLLQQGKSILLTTHFMDEAERLCDRLLSSTTVARSPKARRVNSSLRTSSPMWSRSMAAMHRP